MAKIALILHGWPEYRLKDSFYYRYFADRGYEVLTPNLFSRKFKLTPENVIKEINDGIDDRPVDVIVGISLGGMMLPFVANEYPQAKLIFIASSPYFRTNSNIFNFFVFLAKNDLILQFLGDLVLCLPSKLFIFLCKLAYPRIDCVEPPDFYDRHMRERIEFIRTIPVSEEIEVVDFACSTDNCQLLSKLQNKTLIYSGKEDLVMPVSRGQEMHKLLKNSRLIIKEGAHSNVFSEEDLKDWDEFLADE